MQISEIHSFLQLLRSDSAGERKELDARKVRMQNIQIHVRVVVAEALFAITASTFMHVVVSLAPPAMLHGIPLQSAAILSISLSHLRQGKKTRGEQCKR